MSCAEGPYTPCSCGGIHGVLYSFPHVRVWRASAPVSLCDPAVLGLELHHLTPSKVLHIAFFVTLCEPYLGVDPDLDLWKYFFRVHHPQDPEVELVISGGATIHVKLGHEVCPYLEILMPQSMKGW
jgi:hypothetical protein